MSYDLGTDVDCLDDLSPSFALIDGVTAVAQAIARRLQTPQGSLFYDLEYGFDLGQYVNADVDSSVVAEIKAGVEAEARKDERVSGATANVSYDSSSETLTVTLRCSSANGPFRLTASIADAVSIVVGG